MKTVTLLFLVLATTITCANVANAAFAYPAVPNSKNVFAGAHWCKSITTKTCRGGGGNNAFGAAYAAAGNQWTAALCQADSDGDGITNGAELGDPSCIWTAGNPDPVMASGSRPSHPGFASSVPAPAAANKPASCTRDGDIAALPSQDRTSAAATLGSVQAPPGMTPGDTFTEVAMVYKPAADTFAAENRQSCAFLDAAVKDWHDGATWGGAVPAKGTDVTVPAATKVLISSCSLEPSGYGKITIPENSELIFSDAPIELRVKDIEVLGKLIIGTESCPLHSPVTVSFIGTKSEKDTYSNGIMVQNSGVLNAWGTRSAFTWTRLAATAPAGSFHMVLQDAVDWAPGEQLIVTTSIWRDLEENQNEVRRIVAISTDRKVLVLDQALGFSHYGGPEYQCEVGLLTRSIVFRGTESGYGDSYGGHTMGVGASVTYNLVGVGAERMGQRNIVARYPFHMHLMLEAGRTSTMQQLACKDSYFRCAVIHKTNSTILRKSVSFNSSGHTFYLEEGAEMNNTIDFNLAAYVHPIGKAASGGAQGGEEFDEDADSSQPADHTASGFYVPNPANSLVGNAASGGWSGYSFPIFEDPIRLSVDISFQPYQYKQLKFDGNSAHSSGYFWGDAGCVYVGGKLWEIGSEPNKKLRYSNGRFEQRTYEWPHGNRTAAWHLVQNLRMWLCNKGYSSWGDRADLVNVECIDCKRGAQLFGESSIHHSVFTANSANDPHDMRHENREGFQFYDVWVKNPLVNVTFRNFQRRVSETWENSNTTCIKDLTHSDIFKPWGISATRNLRFENSDQSVYVRRLTRESGASRMFNFVDWDGSVVQSDTCQAYIVGSDISWWDLGSENGCYYRPDWPAYICPRVPGREVVGLDIEMDGVMEEIDVRPSGANQTLSQTDRDRVNIGHISQFAPHDDRRITITRNNHLATGLSGTGWYMWNQVGMPESTKLIPINFPVGNYIVLAIAYPPGTTFEVYGQHRWTSSDVKTYFIPVGSAQEVASGNGTLYRYDGKRLFVKLLDYWQEGRVGFTRHGVDIYDANQGGYVMVEATCTEKNGALCRTPSSPDPPTQLQHPINVCPSAEHLSGDLPPLEACESEGAKPPGWFSNTCYRYRTNSNCKRSTAGECDAFCKPGCHRFLRPYNCSFQPPCDTVNAGKKLRPHCDWVNEDRTYNEQCRMLSCDTETNATLFTKLPVGSACRVGDQPGLCDGFGRCNECGSACISEYTRIDRVSGAATANSLVFSISNAQGLAHGASDSKVSVDVTFAPGITSPSSIAVTSSPVSGHFASMVYHSASILPADMHYIRAVNVTTSNGTRVWDDWHFNRHVTPKITLLCSEGSVLRYRITPATWIESAVLQDASGGSATGERKEDQVFDFDTASLAAGELKLVLSMPGDVKVTRSYPCFGAAANDGSVCRASTTSVNGAPYDCISELLDSSSNYYWLGLAFSGAAPVGISFKNTDTGVWEAQEMSEWNARSYSGRGPNGERQVLVEIRGNFGSYYEEYQVNRTDLGKGYRLKCVMGHKPESEKNKIQVGAPGRCLRNLECQSDKFTAWDPAPVSCSQTNQPRPPPPVGSFVPTPAPPLVNATNAATVDPSNASTSAPSGSGASSAPTPTPTQLAVFAQVRLRGSGFAELLQSRRAELENAALGDLRSIFPSKTVSITTLALGSLVIDFTVLDGNETQVKATLDALPQTEAASNQSSWPLVDALHRTTQLGANEMISTGSSSATGGSIPVTAPPGGSNPGANNGESESSSSCNRGCAVIVVMLVVTAIVIVVALVISQTRRRPVPQHDPTAPHNINPVKQV